MKMTFRWYGEDSDPIKLKQIRQIPGMTGFQEPLFQGDGQRLGAGAADEAAGGDGVAVIDHQGRFFSGDDTYFFHVSFPSLKYNLNFRTAYLFWKCFSLRFSRKAPMPSFWSAVA